MALSQPMREFRGFLIGASLLAFLVKWGYGSWNCVIIYNGGRILPCVVEPMWKDFRPDAVKERDAKSHR